MEHISLSVIRHFIEIHAIIVYFVIFFGVIIEGEIVVILAGIFSFLGLINLFIAFPVIILGGVTKSFLAYTIGYYLNKNHSHKPFISMMERKISYFLPKFNERPFWSIFTSRFIILGVGWFTLLFSGYKRVPIKIYAKAESYSLVLWAIVFFGLGHFFSYTALSISRDVRKFLVIILVFFIMFFIIEKFITFLVRLFNLKHLNGELK